MDIVVFPIADIEASIRPLILPLALFFAELEISFELASVSVFLASFAVLKVVVPLALV